MVADVIGLAFAAFVGPLIVSSLSNNPAGVGRPRRADLRDQPGHDPGVHRRLRPLRSVPRHHPSHLDQCLLRPPQHRARPDDQRVRLCGGGLRRAPSPRHGRGAGDGRQDRRHVPGGRGYRPPGPGGGVRPARPGLRGLGAGDRGGDRQAGPDRGQPPAGPLHGAVRRVRRRQPARSQRRHRRARRAARAVPAVPGGPGGGLFLQNPSGADHRDAQDPERPGGRVHRPPVLRADHRPVPCRGPLRPAHAGHRAGVAERGLPLPQADLRHRGVVAGAVGSVPGRGGDGHPDQGHQRRVRCSSGRYAPAGTSSPSP